MAARMKCHNPCSRSVASIDVLAWSSSTRRRSGVLPSHVLEFCPTMTMDWLCVGLESVFRYTPCASEELSCE